MLFSSVLGWLKSFWHTGENMSRETYSEKMVRIAAAFYKKNKIADIEKVDAKMRIIGSGKIKRIIFSSSSGLDFVGNFQGKYISFEVKETENDDLHIDKINPEQISKMQKIREFGGISFLLCLFKKTGEWFSIGPHEICNAIEINAAYLQKEFFISFGKSVPCIKFPDFLNNEKHPLHEVYGKTFPSWIKYRRERVAPNPYPAIGHDIDSYKERVRNALTRGIKSAEGRERKVQIFKRK
jgi:recombination protein U